MSLYDINVKTISGQNTTLNEFAGKTALIVNVASKCGLTPQYAGLESLYEKYKDKGLVVLGFPCNQFGGQEPGTNEEIAEFCDLNFKVQFPLFDKIDVNGEHRHPLYAALTEVADAEGTSGDIRWNFEKFLVSPSGEAIARFSPLVTPEAEELVAAIEENLPQLETASS